MQDATEIEPADWSGTPLDNMTRGKGHFVAYGSEILLIDGADAFRVATVTADTAGAVLREEIAEALATRLNAAS